MPVEAKVTAASAAAAVSGLILWILGRYVFAGNVPDVLASWVYAAVPALLAFAAGWVAKHTVRPGDPPAPAPAAAVPAAPEPAVPPAAPPAP